MRERDTPAVPPAEVGELLDAFDEGFRPVGKVERRAVHREGLWHEVFHCLVVRPDQPARVLLQRRLRSARTFPGLLDLSATGHLAAGERPLDGVRELAEEIGVVATAEQLVPLGRRLMVDHSGEARNREINREIIHAFLLPLDRPLQSFDLAGRDVDGLVEIDVSDLLRILGEPAATVDCLELDTAGTIRSTKVRSADLVPAVDGYWVVMAVMAARLVDGEHPLAV